MNHQNFERILRFREIPESMLVRVYTNPTHPKNIYVTNVHVLLVMDYDCENKFYLLSQFKYRALRHEIVKSSLW